MRNTIKIVITLFFTASLLIAGPDCKAGFLNRFYKAVGQPISDNRPFKQPRPGTAWIGLSCSGGGSRAAYLTAAVLREIRKSGIRLDIEGESQDDRDLLDQIDFISSVSGGSLSAAYFALNQDKLKESTDSRSWKKFLDRMAVNYRQRQWYWHGIFNPWTWIKVAATNYNRGNIARDHYDKLLYRGASILDLPDRPVLYVNAFDVGNRVRFIFSKHEIDNSAYHGSFMDKGLKSEPLYRENDLQYCGIDPDSVRVADAIYASSAFPFFYPSLALKRYSNPEHSMNIEYAGRKIFLADGGLMDNSGLATLFTQMKSLFKQAEGGRFVVGIFIDASLITDLTPGDGTKFQVEGTEEDYAWSGTYINHGRESLEATVKNHEDSVLAFLENTGVLVNVPILTEGDLWGKPLNRVASNNLSWSDEMRSGKLKSWPYLIGLRLQDITEAYYNLYSARPDDKELDRLLKINNITKSAFPSLAVTNRQLTSRLSKIKTDFKLSRKQRNLLDLAAYILVHGTLKPKLKQWETLINGKK